MTEYRKRFKYFCYLFDLDPFDFNLALLQFKEHGEQQFYSVVYWNHLVPLLRECGLID